ncbi:YtpI family protein [Paenibacillus cymbidii]|uniref:YtpI family protein n=1 Tax=Paenibacillus cymbidii TaxID=1639034 RepID=UPI001081EDF2|nr:YtpI family protein [Paenibacillus cymbidii]
MIWVQALLSAAILVSLLFTVVYSFRYRRRTDPRERGLYAARMNMWMGGMLIVMAIAQFSLFDMNSTRLVLGAVFLLLGLFNLFAGMRNHKLYEQNKQP